RGNPTRSADGPLQGVAKRRCLVRGQFDDEPAATLERDTHDDAPPFLGDLEGTVTGPRLHRRHAEPLPFGASIITRPATAVHVAARRPMPASLRRTAAHRGCDAGAFGAVRPVRRP